jgi:hypothetical protein
VDTRWEVGTLVVWYILHGFFKVNLNALAYTIPGTKILSDQFEFDAATYIDENGLKTEITQREIGLWHH